MNVVLYGATGNSGQRILKELTNRGHHVTAVARDTSKIPSTVKAVKDDLSSVEAIASIIAGADVVVSAYAPPQDNTDALLGVSGRATTRCPCPSMITSEPVYVSSTFPVLASVIANPICPDTADDPLRALRVPDGSAVPGTVTTVMSAVRASTEVP